MAAATGRSKSWVQRHVALYLKGGAEALVPLKRGPRVPANLTSALVEDQIVAWRKRLDEDGLDAGARTIAWHLSQEGATVPALSTIHRILRRRGFVIPQPQKAPPLELDALRVRPAQRDLAERYDALAPRE